MKILKLKCAESVHDPFSTSVTALRQELNAEPAKIPGARPLTMYATPHGVLAIGDRAVLIPYANIRSAEVDLEEAQELATAPVKGARR